MRFKATGLGLAALLAGCGGGGGDDGGSGPAPSATPYTLTFAPATLELTAPAGTSYLMAVDAQIDRPIPEAVNVAIIDRAGVLRPSISVTAVSQTRYRANLTTASTLAQGDHSGSLEVRICRDDPITCAAPIPGSPWQLPFRFTIMATPTPPSPPPPLPPPPAPPPPSLGATFSPASLAVSVYRDELAPIQVVATFANSFSQVYPRFVAEPGVFKSITATNSPGQSTVTMEIAPTLLNATVSGTLRMQLCMDPSCSSEYANSPALLPYTLTILPETNFTVLQPLAGAGDWKTFQGNAGHTGYVPVTLDPSKFNRRWKWTVPATDPAATLTQISPVVAANDRVYFVMSGYFRPSSAYALNEADRFVQWRYDFGSIFAVNPPAVAGDKVFMASSGHSDTFMWSLNASNGTLASKVPFGSQWEHYYAPTIIDGTVYSNGGSYGGLLSFRQSDGALNWFNGSLLQFDEWTPAVDATHAYAFIGGRLFAVDRATGATSYSITDPDWNFGSYSQYSAPMLGGPNTVIGVNARVTILPSSKNRLVNFDTANRSIRWSIVGAFLSEPAIAKGVIYIANEARLEARRESDGALLWSWSPNETSPTPFATGSTPPNIIVTDNLVFVSTVANVYAIDLATKTKVWSFPRGGRMALSRNGVLYISPLLGVPNVAFGTLTAINLQ